MRVARPVVLSPEERARLVRWARGNPSRDLRALRARIVLAAAEGRRDVDIGRGFGVGRLTVARWRQRFLASRLRALDRSPGRRPRSGGIPTAQVRAILRDSVQGATYGPRRTSTRSLARKHGVSHTSVRRIWAEFGIRPAGLGSDPFRADPALPLEPHDVVGVYLRPPDFAVALALGPGRADLERIRPGAPVGTGASGSGVGRALAIGDWAEAVPGRDPTARSRDFLRFLGGVERAVGRGSPVRVIVRMPDPGGVPGLWEWATRHPNVRLEREDDLGAWSTRVQRNLGASGRLPVSKGDAAGRAETSRAIGLFLGTYSDVSGPFEWVASPGEVAESDAGRRLRYELSVTGHPGFKKPLAVRRTVSVPSAPDARAREMARVVLRRCLRVRPGEHVAIETWSETLEYANAFVLEAFKAGARPLVLYQDEPTYWAAVAETRPSNLARVGDHLRAAVAKSDALVTFFGPSDRERHHALPWKTRYRLGEYLDHLYGAAAKAGTRAVQLALGRASPASARMYGVDLAAWKEELIAGTIVDPQLLRRRAQRVARRFAEGRTIEISHANGTRLTLGLRHRRPEVSDGIVPPARAAHVWGFVQLPAGVTTVALDERVGEGTFRSNVPNSVGVSDTVGEVEEGRWTFSGGRLDRFSYVRGQELFEQSYERAGPGRERVGTLSVGLNDRIAMSPLLLDQAAGALTLQIGRNDHVGGATPVLWWAWLILRGGDLRVDGTTLVRGGKLVE